MLERDVALAAADSSLPERDVALLSADFPLAERDGRPSKPAYLLVDLGDFLLALAATLLTRELSGAQTDFGRVAFAARDIDDLVSLSGYSSRGIRHSITKGLLPRPKLAGSATRYSRETLGRLAAIRVWRDEDKLSLTRIKRELRQLTEEEVEDWACKLDPPEGKIGDPVITLEPTKSGARSGDSAGVWELRLKSG